MELRVNSKFIWKCKRSSRAETILKKENKIEELTLLDFMTDYKALVIKFQHKNIQINGTEESPETDPTHIYNRFDKSTKEIQ